MNAELKRKWVEALRSGKYRQGRGCLREDADDVCRYCCIGVLEDIRYDGKWQKKRGNMYRSMGGSTWWTDFELVPTGTQDELIDLNDTQGKSFPEIADWIEQNIPTDEETP